MNADKHRNSEHTSHQLVVSTAIRWQLLTNDQECFRRHRSTSSDLYSLSVRSMPACFPLVSAEKKEITVVLRSNLVCSQFSTR